MMGDATSLPLPAAQPTANPLATASGATAAAAPAIDAGAATETPANIGTLFDLLLGNSTEPASAMAAALPTTGRSRTGAPSEQQKEPAPASADPLMVVLAQMPQLQPIAPTTPGTPATGTAAAAPIISTGLAAQESAAAVPPGLAGAAAPAVAPQATTSALPAQATERMPSFALPQATERMPSFALPQAQAQASAPVAMPLDASALAAAAGEGAATTVEAAAPSANTPLHAIQASAPASPLSPPVAASAPILQQPAEPGAGYDDRFAGHVAWMAGQRIAQAEIRVVPEHLGVIDIQLQMDGSEVRAEFHSSQPEVRQALEASLPRLRDMLGQHGMQLAHAGVGQGQGQKQQQGDGMPQPGQQEGFSQSGQADIAPAPDSRRGRGLLDVYA